jgi:hypothetical protein
MVTVLCVRTKAQSILLAKQVRNEKLILAMGIPFVKPWCFFPKVSQAHVNRRLRHKRLLR